MSTTGDTRSWRGGRLFPLFGSLLFLVLFASFAHWRPSDVGDAVNLLGPGLTVVFVIVFLAGIAVALRRKATLTPDTLVVRTVWRTHRVPLRDIASIGMGKVSRTSFTQSLVGITVANGPNIRTMAFGMRPTTAVRTIVAAAQAVGAQPTHHRWADGTAAVTPDR